MKSKLTLTLIHKTPLNIIDVNSLIQSITCDLVNFNYDFFKDLCKSGCRNYEKKYSCPPYSFSFNDMKSKYRFIVVNCLCIEKSSLKIEYNSIRIANVVLKSIQKKAFNFISTCSSNGIFPITILENGSCRLCKKCKLQDDLPCKYPHLMHPSLEATGVDVNDLVKKAFGFELQWYKKDSFPEYQCVVGGILTNDPEIVQAELLQYYQNNYSCEHKSKVCFKSLEAGRTFV